MNTTKIQGYFYGIIAAMTYGMNPLFAMPLYSDGLTPSNVLALRYIIALIILYIMIKLRGRSIKITVKDIIPLFILGILMGLSSLTLFKSYNYMSTGIASTILFVYPLMVAIIMTCFFHEKIKLLTATCIIMALSGIGLLYKNSDGGTLSTTGTILIMISALSYSIYLVWINRPRFKNIPTLVLTFYVILFGSIVFIFEPIYQHSFTLPTTPLYWGCAIALGLLPTAVSLICTTIAIHKIGSTITAILGALEPLTAIFIGLILFGETLTTRDIIGLTLILSAVTIVIAGDSITQLLLRMKKLFPSVYNTIFKHKTP